MKAKNIKKILAIVLVSIVLLLTTVTVILAVVPYNLYNPINESFVTMTVYRDKISNLYTKGDKGSSEQNKVINDILDLNKKSLKANTLSSLFQGATSYDVKVEDKKIENVRNLYNNDGVLALVFNYLDDIQTLKIDGEVYKHKTTFDEQTVQYTKLVMIIENKDSYSENTIYLINGNKDTSSYQIKYLAHQSDVWDYIKNLDLPLVKA